jgi:hypothetical protein
MPRGQGGYNHFPNGHPRNVNAPIRYMKVMQYQFSVCALKITTDYVYNSFNTSRIISEMYSQIPFVNLPLKTGGTGS